MLIPPRRCGDHFPRGRIDTLTSHLTKKCPGISEAERMNALLVISGMNSASQVQPQHVQHGQPSPHHVNGLVDLPILLVLIPFSVLVAWIRRA